MTAPPTKPKAAPDFADARKACRTPEEHERLAKIIKAGWTSAEFHEYARLYFFRNGRDYPTPTSYRRAIADIANCESLRRSAVEGRQFGPQSGLNGLLLTKTKPAGFGAGGDSRANEKTARRRSLCNLIGLVIRLRERKRSDCDDDRP